MNRFKALALMSLLGVVVGLYFTVNFFNIFLWDNTLFANSNQIIYIDSDDNFDSLVADLGPYLKSKDNFITAAYKKGCLLYTSPSPRDRQKSRMPSSA